MKADEFGDILKEVMKPESIPEGICCVCGHALDNHIDEGEVWRCHSLGQDFYQCECVLRKDRGFFTVETADPISYYDMKRRANKHLQEFKEGRG